MLFTEKQLNASAHTLWQAAVASGGVGEIAKSVTDHSVNIPGVEQGLVVAGVAVGGAALSLLKAAAVNYAAIHKNSKAVKAAAEVENLAKQVAAYQAKHAPVAPSQNTTVSGSVPPAATPLFPPAITAALLPPVN